MRGYVVPLIGPVVVLIIWFLVTAGDSPMAPALLLPSPGDTFGYLWGLLATNDIGPDISASLYRWAMGYALGCLAGVPIGLLIGSSRQAFESTYVTLDFFRSLPVTALFPLFLLVFGIGDSSKIAMVFAGTFPVVVLASAYGVMNAAKTRIRAARTFGASRLQIFRWVIFFEALPQTLVGMRTSLSLALIVVVVSEMFIGTRVGLGQRIYESYTVNNTVELYAVLLLTGLLGYAMNRIFLALEKRIVFWAGR